MSAMNYFVSPSSWADAATNLNHISASFDQEASAVVMARMAVARYVRKVNIHVVFIYTVRF